VIGFVGPDEPRYAWIARDMAETGDWVTPRLYGRPWFEKPPLLYWGGATFFKLLGEGHPEVAARLPSAISALLATLALAWLAWRTYGEECARWLLLLLPTNVGMIGFSHACATDMPFAGMLTMAMVCAAVALGLTRSGKDTPTLPRTPWTALLLFGFFLGLAVLAKGPAAVIFAAGTRFWLASLRQTLARSVSAASSGRDGLVLRYRSPVVRPLLSPQLRFLPHLHHRAQHQALRHARIPTHPAFLVLPACPSSIVSAVVVS